MTDDEIRLTLPAVPEFARLARLTVAGLANRVGFDYDEVEDLRIAVGEACSLLMGGEARDGDVTLVFRITDDGLEISAGGHALNDPTAAVDEGLSTQILEAVVDDFRVDPTGVHLRKRRSDGIA